MAWQSTDNRPGIAILTLLVTPFILNDFVYAYMYSASQYLVVDYTLRAFVFGAFATSASLRNCLRRAIPLRTEWWSAGIWTALALIVLLGVEPHLAAYVDSRAGG